MDLSLFNGSPLHIDANWLFSRKGLIDNILRNITIEGMQKIRQGFFSRLTEKGDEMLFTGSEPVQFSGNTAIVPIKGIISKELDIFSFFFGGTSTDMLRQVASIIGEMSDVRNVLLNVDSPGGSVSGLVLASEAFRELRKKKNVIAFSNDLNASAAFQISSASNGIFVNPSSQTGSFGTLAVIMNGAKMFEDAGLQVEVIRSGDFKAKPNPFERFDDTDRKIVREAVNKHFNDFVDTVSLNLNIPTSEALKMANGLLHEGENAIGEGFAVGVGTIEQAVSQMQSASEPVTLNGIMNRWNHIFKSEGVSPQPSTKPQQSKNPMSDQNNTQANAEIAAIREQLAEMQNALTESTQLITAQAAIIKENGFKSVDAENQKLVNGLIEDQRVKARFRNSLPAFMGSLARSNEKITFHNGEETVQVSQLEFFNEFLNSLTPMVPTSKKLKDTDAAPVNLDNTSEIMQAARRLQLEAKELGQEIDVVEAVGKVAMQQSGVA